MSFAYISSRLAEVIQNLVCLKYSDCGANKIANIFLLFSSFVFHRFVDFVTLADRV